VRTIGFIPDSAIAIDRNREAQPFRSEVDGFYSEGVQFVQKVQIGQNVLNGLNGLNVLNPDCLLQDSTSLPAFSV
jgi:hypothetical protein